MKTRLNTALEIALQTEWFKKVVEHVNEHMEKGTQSSCYLFAIDGIVYYYGFDGVDLHLGAHSPKRSAWEIEHNEAYIIR